MNESPSSFDENAASPKEKTLTPEAKRALAEAQERRRQEEERRGRAGAAPARPEEFYGPSGPEPVRYGDWERKGIASDF